MRFSVCLEVFLLFYISFFGVRCWKLSSDNTETISQSIKSIRDEVLGVSKFQALIKDVAKLESISFDSQATAVKVARSISAKFKNRATAVLRLQKEVADGFTAQKWSQWQKCCKIPNPGPSDPKIDPQALCSIESSTATESHKTPNENFLKVAQENKDRYPGLKWQYFGSEHGVFTHYPASYISSCNTTYDNRFRPWYVQASTPKPKDVIIAIDKSGSMLTNNRIGAAV
uniref:Uncharacterized protein n=1 Tax=Ciona savignyi TaxID=51511 RepID=H2ZN00_CIOSA